MSHSFGSSLQHQVTTVISNRNTCSSSVLLFAFLTFFFRLTSSRQQQESTKMGRGKRKKEVVLQEQPQEEEEEVKEKEEEEEEEIDQTGSESDSEQQNENEGNEDNEEESEESEEEEEEIERDSTSDNYSHTDEEEDSDDEEVEEFLDDAVTVDSSNGSNNDQQLQQQLLFESPDSMNSRIHFEQEEKSDQDEEEDGNERKKNKRQKVDKDQDQPPPKLKLAKGAKDKSQRLIVILERANLELVKTARNNFELINCDDHMGLIRKYRKDPAFCRPDITHQCLLMLFDSPLNRAGFLQVYIHTINNVLIEINPQTRFPRTFKRFANLIVQLLHRMSIKSAAAPGGQKLLRVVRNPVTAHLPVGCKKYGTSFQAEKLIHASELVPTMATTTTEECAPVVVVIGAMAHGTTGADYVEETVSISQYPLSGALACSKICSAFEDAWGIH